MNLEQIDTSTTAGKAEVMRLAAEGRQLLIRSADLSDSWEPIHEIVAEWNWRECEYGILAAPGMPERLWIVLADDGSFAGVGSYHTEAYAKKWSANYGGIPVEFVRADLVACQKTGSDGLPMVLVSHEFKAQAEYDAAVTSAVANLLRGNQLGISGSQPEMVSALMRIASSPTSAIEALSESEKDVALAQAVEFAEYVERQAKGAMVDAAKRFLSLPYAQELAKRLTPPEGYVLVPVEPTEKMLDALYRAEGDMSDDDLRSLWGDVLAARPEVP
ncbi:hypothetical protein [Stenotrophomonas maltophilia]|uniref:hypothetical protein n=1 Tax=Stenotrophomonas maltophilia TaxID=40324 RepID=UPI001562C82D|nr:hypothetical protein [Stenotrophomonas maltophilia]NRP03277.1 hypothetical protein [Stenotrophomonas maltophilia]